MAATSLEVPSEDDIRIILVCSVALGGDMLCDPTFGAMGLVPWTICS